MRAEIDFKTYSDRVSLPLAHTSNDQKNRSAVLCKRKSVPFASKIRQNSLKNKHSVGGALRLRIVFAVENDVGRLSGFHTRWAATAATKRRVSGGKARFSMGPRGASRAPPAGWGESRPAPEVPTDRVTVGGVRRARGASADRRRGARRRVSAASRSSQPRPTSCARSLTTVCLWS